MQKTILVVDDEEGIVEVLAFALEENYTVLKASNGHDAYDMLQEHPVDMVISDYMMPGLNGIELYFRMLEDPVLRKIPFIMISAFSGDIAHAPMYAIFPKPFAIDKLMETVAVALD